MHRKLVNAVKPKVLPFENSKSPASICAKPPKAKPIANTRPTFSPPKVPLLIKLKSQVVKAKPHKPNGAGFAVKD